VDREPRVHPTAAAEAAEGRGLPPDGAADILTDAAEHALVG
jgi:hypothetical protein